MLLESAVVSTSSVVLAPRFGMEMKRVREGLYNTSYMRLKRGAVRTFSDVACPGVSPMPATQWLNFTYL